MSNLFTRLKNTITADFHEMLDQKEQKNPIALLNQYLRQCEQETEKVRKLVERQFLLKEEFTREYRHARDLAEKRRHQAEIAAQADESELQEFAVQESVQYEERSLKVKEALQKAVKQLDELERKYEEMKHKLKDMNLKRLELMGRENMARAHHRMNQVLESTTYSNQPMARFEEMESYLDQLEHLVTSSYHRNTIDARIAQLEKEVKNNETHSVS
ncbi:PspA/IM30 family protein [Peribacillus cavernae]|uniref:PspA/IM30 family protein n=1 Tax=Peribacillus cavernae TaxID=1674310 RepID=A0A433HTG3_9BACI|nr:PspA/IM30 family protein [Peribacillus cavernae]MDQ0218613.1 phage shock protein A [Peribacillus cavernae]RUQ31597.1 PspA/IM30 family protein [Peribacillus cavernae]